MDKTHSPYASAQYMLQILGDIPDLWEPGGADELVQLLREWDENRDDRPAVADRIRAHRRSLRGSDVPPLGASDP